MAQGILAGRYKASRPRRMIRARRARPTTASTPTACARRASRPATASPRSPKQFGLPPAQLSLLWCKDQPGITAPIFGPRTMEQLQDVLPVLEMSLSDEERAACDTINPPGNAIADYHNSTGWMKSEDRSIKSELINLAQLAI